MRPPWSRAAWPRALVMVLAVPAAVLTGVAPSSPANAVVAPPPSFVIDGAGYGHGVGMSQYGAYAQAAAGRTAAQILATYYTGTALSAVTDSAEVRVQILGGVSSAKASSTSLSGASGGGFQVIGAATLAGKAGDSVTFVASSSGIKATITGTAGTRTTTGTVVSLQWQGTRYLAGGATVVDVPGAGGRYRRGRIEVRQIGGKVNVVNRVRIHDEYLDGIAEVPSSWPAQALQAQAIAARTYTMRAVAGGVKTSCDCTLYDEVTSQKFTGWSKEGESSGGTSWGARWTAAVAATSPSATTGKIITYGGSPIDAVYFSSDGGRTQNSEDVWSSTVPYLRSVADPWSLQAPNPNRSWQVSVTQAAMAKAVGLPDVVGLDLTDRTAGLTVDHVVARSSSGATKVLTGSAFRSALGLRSMWLTRPVTRLAGTDRYSTAVAAAARIPTTSHTAVIVSGADAAMADGLVAAPLARRLGAPLLFVTANAVPSVVSSALTARAVTKVVVVGGTPSVSAGVVDTLDQMGMQVERLSGPDRYSVAAAVARRMGPSATALVAAGDNGLYDALVASATAAAAGRPLLLVRGTVVPPATAQALTDLGVRATTCVGGPSSLSEAVRLAMPACTRVSGSDRYSTATSLAYAFRALVPPLTPTVAAGDATTVADGVIAAMLGRPLLLVKASSVPAQVSDFVHRTQVSSMSAIGGPTSVTPAVLTQLSRL